MHVTTQTERALEEVISAIEFLSPSEAREVLQEALDMVKEGEKQYRIALGII